MIQNNQLVLGPNFGQTFITQGSLTAAQLAYYTAQGASFGNYVIQGGDVIDGVLADAADVGTTIMAMLYPNGDPVCVLFPGSSASGGATSAMTRIDDCTIQHSNGAGTTFNTFSPIDTFEFTKTATESLTGGTIGSIGAPGTYFDPYTAFAEIENNTCRNMLVVSTAEYETSATVTDSAAVTLGLQIDSAYLGVTDVNVGGSGVGSQNHRAGTHKLRDSQHLFETVIAPGDTFDARVRPVMFLNNGTVTFNSINYRIKLVGHVI